MNEIPDITSQLNDFVIVDQVTKNSQNYFITLKKDGACIMLKLKLVDRERWPYGMSLYYGSFLKGDESHELISDDDTFYHVSIASSTIPDGLSYLFKTFDDYQNTIFKIIK